MIVGRVDGMAPRCLVECAVLGAHVVERDSGLVRLDANLGDRVGREDDLMCAEMPGSSNAPCAHSRVRAASLTNITPRHSAIRHTVVHVASSAPWM